MKSFSMLVVLCAFIAESALLLAAQSHKASLKPLFGTATTQQPSHVSPGSPTSSKTSSSLHAIGQVSLNPTTIIASTQALVTVTARITDPDLIPDSVTALLAPAPSASQAVLGSLHSQGNGIYVGQFTLNQQHVGDSFIFVSAAFRGVQGKVFSTPTVLHVWKKFSNTNLQIQLGIPPLGQPVQASVYHPSNGTTTIDFQILNPADQTYLSEFGLVVYDNPTHASLSDWFEQNVDVNGVLLASNTFQAQTLGNGLQVLVRVQSVPASYFDSEGPVEDAYVLSSSGARIIGISPSQENTFSDLGYTEAAIEQLLLQVMSTSSF